MPEPASIACLLDVDNTLLDNDRGVADLKRHLAEAFDDECQERYWRIFDQRREEFGYADYLGALQQFRCEKECDPHFLQVSLFLLAYPFQERLFPGALDVIAHLGRWGPTIIYSDGDVVFQPHKVKRSGLYDAVNGRVLIYIHKERAIDDLEQRYPAEHYVLVDDKRRILSAVKDQLGERVTTIDIRQGHYVNEPKMAPYPHGDRTIETINELLKFDRAELIGER
jgi:FMN phosphatase YigB (HAD superfamily)